MGLDSCFDARQTASLFINPTLGAGSRLRVTMKCDERWAPRRDRLGDQSPPLALDLARSNWVQRNGNGKWQGIYGVDSEEGVINTQEKNFLLVASSLNDKPSLPEFL